MTAPWLRVRMYLPSAKVAQRLAALCKGDAQKAAGVLIDFWSSVSDHATNGFIRDHSDSTLEDWAKWRGKPGAFAAWVRAHHMDEDGRVKEWDEYMGALEARRAADRNRKRRERELKSLRRHADVPQDVHRDSPRDVRESSAPARAKSTVRYVDERETEAAAARAGREMLLDRMGAISATRRDGIAAKLRQFEQGYGLPPGTGIPTAEQIDMACLDVVSTVDLGSLNANTLAKFVAKACQPIESARLALSRTRPMSAVEIVREQQKRQKEAS